MTVGCVQRNVVNPHVEEKPTAGACGSLTECLVRATEQLRLATAEVQLWAARAAPVGTIEAWASPAELVPEGWKICNGAPLERAKYPALFAVLQYRYGGAGESFNLPDYRGWFLRGVDQNAHHDLATGERGPIPGTTSKVAGDDVGTFQAQAIQAHQHEFKGDGADFGPYPFFVNGQAHPAGGINTHLDGGGPETRPSNVSVYWIIRIDY